MILSKSDPYIFCKVLSGYDSPAMPESLFQKLKFLIFFVHCRSEDITFVVIILKWGKKITISRPLDY